MQYPYPNYHVCTNEGFVALEANVPMVVNAIRARTVIPYGDYGGPTVYYFSVIENGLGNLIYTTFDRDTNLALASFTVRYGAATTIKQILFDPYPRSPIHLQYLILPQIPYNSNPHGKVLP